MGESEVADLWLALLGQKDVCRPDRAVDDSLSVGVGETLAGGHDDLDRLPRIDCLAV
jgi:hypothetical protein